MTSVLALHTALVTFALQMVFKSVFPVSSVRILFWMYRTLLRGSETPTESFPGLFQDLLP